MGFEQLAELKKQLAAKARAEQPSTETNSQPEARQKPAGEPGRRGQRPQASGDRASGDRAGKGRPGREHAGRNRADHQRERGLSLADGAGARARPARKPAEPVDPVVLSIGRLQKHFPSTFPKNPAPKLPLKIGIHQDLLAKAKDIGLEEAAITEAVKTWCRGTRYWAAIVEDAPRIDLEGQPAGSVSARDAALARSLENRRKARQAKPKAAEAGAVAAEQKVTDQEVTEQATEQVPAAIEAGINDASAAPAPDAE